MQNLWNSLAQNTEMARYFFFKSGKMNGGEDLSDLLEFPDLFLPVSSDCKHGIDKAG